jgi:hypothetical protein
MIVFFENKEGIRVVMMIRDCHDLADSTQMLIFKEPHTDEVHADDVSSSSRSYDKDRNDQHEDIFSDSDLKDLNADDNSSSSQSHDPEESSMSSSVSNFDPGSRDSSACSSWESEDWDPNEFLNFDPEDWDRNDLLDDNPYTTSHKHTNEDQDNEEWGSDRDEDVYQGEQSS